MKIQYLSKAFSRSSLELIDLANEVIADFTAAGYRLTLRQLFYQLVGAAKIANNQKTYDRLGRVLTDARNAGLVDWNAIEDRTRGLQGEGKWEDAAQILRAAMEGFKLDRWDGQSLRPELWIEKQALESLALSACSPLDVDVMVCRGYMSASEMHAAAKRMNHYVGRGQTPVIIHLGDHDPSGIDMTRDITDRLQLYMGNAIVVNRIALNHDQVADYNLPPNPTKLKDSRAVEYISLYGKSSWELDALRPGVLVELIQDAIEPMIDQEQLERTMRRERAETAFLTDALQRHEEMQDDIPF